MSEMRDKVKKEIEQILYEFIGCMGQDPRHTASERIGLEHRKRCRQKAIDQILAIPELANALKLLKALEAIEENLNKATALILAKAEGKEYEVAVVDRGAKPVNIFQASPSSFLEQYSKELLDITFKRLIEEGWVKEVM